MNLLLPILIILSIEASEPSTSKTVQNKMEENELSSENDTEKIEELVFSPEEK